MEGEVCLFQKFGFCKFQGGCKRKHFQEVCDQLSKCNNIKQCEKRHPKTCKRYASGKICRFQEDCAYFHQVENQEGQNELQLKVDMLEKMVVQLNKKEESKKVEKLEEVVKALCRKVLSLEGEITEMKKIKISNDKVEAQGLSIDNKEKETEAEEVVDDYKSSFNPSELKDKSSTPEVKKDRVEKYKTKGDLLNCEMCNYTCKKESSLKNHVLNKHDTHECKECKVKLPSFMKLLKHIAEHHYKEEENVQDEQAEDYEAIKIHKQGYHENEHVAKEKEVEVSESMLDDILLEGY